MDEVERLCDRIAIMNEGKIVAEGTAAELKEFVAQKIRDRAAENAALEATANAAATVALAEANGAAAVVPAATATSVGAISAARSAEIVGGAEANMEDVFIALTGKDLKEEGAAED
jgi:ABC-type multidrug transport system ATPase subunit